MRTLLFSILLASQVMAGKTKQVPTWPKPETYMVEYSIRDSFNVIQPFVILESKGVWDSTHKNFEYIFPSRNLKWDSAGNYISGDSNITFSDFKKVVKYWFDSERIKK